MKPLSPQELTERSLPPRQSPPPAGSSVRERERSQNIHHLCRVFTAAGERDAAMGGPDRSPLLIDDFHRKGLQE